MSPIASSHTNTDRRAFPRPRLAPPRLHPFRYRTLSGLLLILLITATGCASAGGGGSEMGESRVLTAAQMEDTDARNVLEAIQRARPLWLSERSPRSLGHIDTRILVFFNGARVGSAEDTLRSMALDGISRIEYVDAAEAGLLPGAGSGHVRAAFLIYSGG